MALVAEAPEVTEPQPVIRIVKVDNAAYAELDGAILRLKQTEGKLYIHSTYEARGTAYRLRDYLIKGGIDSGRIERVVVPTDRFSSSKSVFLTFETVQ